jgi:drug/metabolite transporter (DMT)-like permease
MLWLILCILAALTWSFSAFIDNYQTDVIFKGRTPQAMKVLNGPVYIVISIIVGIIFRIQFPELGTIGFLMLSGALSSIGALAYYQALEHEEATGAAITYQLQPILFLLIDFIIFGEQISIRQILGFIIILLAPVIVVFSRKRANSRRMEVRAIGLLILYVVIATISAEISTRSSGGVDFKSVFVFYLLGRGVMDVIIGLFPKYRKRHKYILAHRAKAYVGTVVVNQCLCALADFAYRYGLIIGIAAIASAVTNAAELILTFTLGIILSIIWPNFGREKLKHRLVVAHIIAVILCVIGIIIIQ